MASCAARATSSVRNPCQCHEFAHVRESAHCRRRFSSRRKNCIDSSITQSWPQAFPHPNTHDTIICTEVVLLFKMRWMGNVGIVGRGRSMERASVAEHETSAKWLHGKHTRMGMLECCMRLLEPHAVRRLVFCLIAT